MNLYLLDTNICIHFLKGQYSLVERIKNVGPYACYISEITIAELLFGVENSSESQRQKNRKNVQEFLILFQGERSISEIVFMNMLVKNQI
jgi:tRNA(fMet)-specific endonuclease VapC